MAQTHNHAHYYSSATHMMLLYKQLVREVSLWISPEFILVGLVGL